MDYPPTKMSQASVATAAADRRGARRCGVRGGRGHQHAPGWCSRRTGAWRSRARRRGPRPSRPWRALRARRRHRRSASGCGWPGRSSPRYPAQLRHAILLTDGKNEHETPERLAAELSQCEGRFSCDCRGRGHRLGRSASCARISTALLGTVDIVPDPAGLAADFAAMMESAMGKQVADVSLRVWTPQHAPRSVRQAGRARGRGPDRPAHPVGPAGRRLPDRGVGAGESRDYHVGVEVAAGCGRAGNAGRPGQPGAPRVRGPVRPGPGPGDLDR